PGEDLHEAKRKITIREMMGNAPLGIINVVSYGYHEPDIDVETAMDGPTVRPEFLSESRDLEIERLKEWTNLLCGEGGPAKWLLTVVSKADLWWTPSGEKEVLDHYRSGSYRHALGESFDGAKITHSVTPVASLNQPLFGVGPMSGFYSDEIKTQHTKELLSLILRYASKEE
ncbi:MAG: hypothetical protein AAGH82_09585, partial [Pseudomonadota bacterium]